MAAIAKDGRSSRLAHVSLAMRAPMPRSLVTRRKAASGWAEAAVPCRLAFLAAARWRGTYSAPSEQLQSLQLPQRPQQQQNTAR